MTNRQRLLKLREVVARMEPAGAERHRRRLKGKLDGEASESIEPVRSKKASLSPETERDHEAGAGIEPANSGFADRDLTTWLPRQLARADNIVVAALVSSAERREIAIGAANPSGSQSI